MKKTKRLFSLLLTLMMVLALAVPALADGEEGSGTSGSEAAAGSYSIKITAMDASNEHVFNAYQIFKGTLSSDGTLTNVEWGEHITESDELYEAIKKIDIGTDESPNTPFSGITQNTAASVSDVLADNNGNADVVEAFQEVIAKKLNDVTAISVGQATNLGSGIYYVDVSSAGYYLVKDERTDNTNVADMMLQVVGNVDVIAKLQVPSVTKYAGIEAVTDNATFSVGDEIRYTLKGTTPNYATDDANANYSYRFTDTMDSALTLVYTPSNSNEEQVESGVTVTVDTKNITNKFLITYKDNVLTIESKENLASSVTADSIIEVTYYAKINSNVLESTVVNNKVKVESQMNMDGQTVTPEVTEQVYPITLEITKVDGADVKEVLEGAEFILTRVVNGETQYATTNLNGKFTGWTTDKSNATTLTTDAAGKINLVGIGAGSFTLTETKAPTGYNKLDAAVVIEIQSTSKTSATGTVELESLQYSLNGGAAISVTGNNLGNGIVAIQVENNQGAQLPSTGGIGTTIFYVIGGILVLGAVVLLITRKRMDRE